MTILTGRVYCQGFIFILSTFRSLAIIDPSGFWLGEDDGGLGSPTIRHTGCQHGVHAKKPYIEDIPQADS